MPPLKGKRLAQDGAVAVGGVGGLKVSTALGVSNPRGCAVSGRAGMPRGILGLLLFNCQITLTKETQMSLNYSLAILSFSHKELVKLPQGLSVGRICLSFMGGIAENERNLHLTSWPSVLFGLELCISVQIYSRVNKSRAGLGPYNSQL